MRTSRAAAWRPLLLGGVLAAAFVASLVVGAGHMGAAAVDVGFYVIFMFWGFLGAVILWQQPGQTVGRLLYVAGVVSVVSFLLEMLAAGGSGTAAWLEGWVGDWLTPLPVVLTLLIFPAGRLRTRLERTTAVLAILMCVLGAATVAFSPGRLPDRTIDNPYGLPGVEPVTEVLRGVIVDGPAFALVFVLALVCLVKRLRRSRGVERQQMKWFVYSVALLVGVIFIGGLFTTFGDDSELGDAIGGILFMISVIAIPIAITLAMLRYRLYEIDVLINRTLVYGALTAFLVATYLGIVVTLGFILEPFTADSDISVAASTLAVAALFRPLRGRVQRFIDKRFYRSRYDAARTLDAFGARLRDAVELPAVRSDMLAVLGGALHPSHASVWLREDPR